MVLLKEMNEEERGWDAKKIALGVAALAVVIGMVVVFKSGPSKQGEVAGVTSFQRSTKPTLPTDPAPQIRDSVQNKLDSIKEEVTNLDLKDVANTSPQVQKVLNDIKNLENLPKDQAKSACMQICSKL